ncbi:DNA-binding response regulator [Salipaludibacillus keqinensis]|uniref:DNA-binding response regulator n=1 Tax=Salipaludibacillus keqinensis TaxID=2045207 RepID=A0A323TZD2_9BACI|nr:response regulator transcription factor [Salipaludibacillus keqinensis]PYZ94945.1 DNA-binding response regulator [Salipaludibacillus keqinensis]
MIKIMIVDDHAILRDGLKTIFSMEEDLSVVSEAESGEEALTTLENGEEFPDLIIMDINLPKLDGVEMTKEVKRLYPHVKVLILTMYKHDEYFMSAIKGGADGYLLKDAPSEQVVDAARSLMLGEAVIHSSMTKKLLDLHQQPDGKKEEDELTDREKDVLICLVKGLSNKEIAKELFISDKTVKIHVSKIFKKLAVKSRSQAVIYAIQHKLVRLND